MFGSWAAFAQSEYQAETDLRSIEITTLPDDVVERFQLPADKQFIKRSRLTRIGVSVSKREKCTLRNMWRTDLEVVKLTE
jgi:hypothetical protein